MCVCVCLCTLWVGAACISLSSRVQEECSVRTRPYVPLKILFFVCGIHTGIILMVLYIQYVFR